MLGYGSEPMGRGLTHDEAERLERSLGFRFSPVHRAFLILGLPRGPQWPPWRTGSVRDLRALLRVPVDGIVADVLEHDFWPTRWGVRPSADDDRESVAREALGRVPTLVPLFARSYLPAEDPRAECPVLSVDRTAVEVVGHDLAHYVGRVFVVHDPAPTRRPLRVPFWSDLAELFDPARRRPGIMSP
jgi:hypothetical protein